MSSTRLSRRTCTVPSVTTTTSASSSANERTVNTVPLASMMASRACTWNGFFSPCATVNDAAPSSFTARRFSPKALGTESFDSGASFTLLPSSSVSMPIFAAGELIAFASDEFTAEAILESAPTASSQSDTPTSAATSTTPTARATHTDFSLVMVVMCCAASCREAAAASASACGLCASPCSACWMCAHDCSRDVSPVPWSTWDLASWLARRAAAARRLSARAEA